MDNTLDETSSRGDHALGTKDESPFSQLEIEYQTADIFENQIRFLTVDPSGYTSTEEK